MDKIGYAYAMHVCQWSQSKSESENNPCPIQPDPNQLWSGSVCIWADVSKLVYHKIMEEFELQSEASVNVFIDNHSFMLLKLFKKTQRMLEQLAKAASSY